MTEEIINIQDTPYLFDARQQDMLHNIAARVTQMRQAGKLSPAALAMIRKYFRIKNIYHSNAIEGNTLNVGETRQVVELGLTLTGKPLKDQAEAKNLSEALAFLEELATNNLPITERDVRQIHFLVLKGIQDTEAGKYRGIKVEISGSAYIPPPPESIPLQMEAFGKWLSTASIPGDEFASLSSLIRAVVAHAWFVYIHPFVDGNGRTARLLMNLILMRYGYPVAIIAKEDRLRYYDALETSQSSDLSPFMGLVAECILESLEEYERAVARQIADAEWAKSIADRLTERERTKKQNEYEIWKSAMDLLKSYFRQTVSLVDDTAIGARIFFTDFGELEFEKYDSLSQGESAKRTWFFRVDFLVGNRTARYLFFFGGPSYLLRQHCDVALHVAREERPYSYDRLENIAAPNVPGLLEIGYKASEESFYARYRDGTIKKDVVEQICRQFMEEVVRMHFSQ
jgi:Fic family protein